MNAYLALFFFSFLFGGSCVYVWFVLREPYRFNDVENFRAIVKRKIRLLEAERDGYRSERDSFFEMLAQREHDRFSAPTGFAAPPDSFNAGNLAGSRRRGPASRSDK